MLIFKAGINFAGCTPSHSPLPRISSMAELIPARNRFCGISAWGPLKFKNLGSVPSGMGALTFLPASSYSTQSPYFKFLRSPGIDSKASILQAYVD